MQDMPFFMEDSSWYYFDGKRFALTDKAPEKAKKSLQEFYQTEKQILSTKEEPDARRNIHQP